MKVGTLLKVLRNVNYVLINQNGNERAAGHINESGHYDGDILNFCGDTIAEVSTSNVDGEVYIYIEEV